MASPRVRRISKDAHRRRIHDRVRTRVSGTTERPRLCVYRSVGHIYTQVIDDSNGKTLASASSVDKQTHVTVTGADKGQVGQVAANLRSLRPPDPYKQKGVRITGERLKKKAGKAGAKAGGA